jgi:hypothetical protein
MVPELHARCNIVLVDKRAISHYCFKVGEQEAWLGQVVMVGDVLSEWRNQHYSIFFSCHVCVFRNKVCC